MIKLTHKELEHINEIEKLICNKFNLYNEYNLNTGYELTRQVHDHDPDLLITLYKVAPELFTHVSYQTVDSCIMMLKMNWSMCVLNNINLIMRGTLLKEYNRLILEKGPIENIDNDLCDEITFWKIYDILEAIHFVRFKHKVGYF